MAFRIMKKNIELIECSSGMFDTLTYNFEELIRKKRINTSEIIILINEMKFHTETMYPVFDISEFIQESRSIKIVIDLLEQTIAKIQHTLREQALKNLWKFHAELVKYKEELEAQGK